MVENIKKAVKNSIVYGIGNLSVKLIGLILFPIYTGHLSVSEYGILGILEVSFQVFVALFGLSLYSAFFRYYYDTAFKTKQKSMFYSVLLFLLGMVAVMYFLVVPFSGQLSEILFDSPDYTYVVTLMIFSSGIQIINNLPSTLIRLLEKPMLYTISNILRLLLILGLTIYLIVHKGRGLAGIYEAQIAGHLFYFVLLSGLTLKNIKFKFEFHIIRVLLAFSLPLILSSVSGVLLTVTDRYCLKFLSGLSDVGIYSAGYKIANVLLFIVSAAQLAVTPIIYQKINDPDNKRFYSKIMTYTTYVLVFLTIGLSVLGKEVIKVLAQNADYWQSFYIIPVIAFSIIFGALRYTSSTGLIIAEKTGIMASVTIVISLINLGLNFGLIPFFNSMGAAFATLLTQMLYFSIIYFFSQKRYPIPYELKKVLLMVMLGALLTGIAFVINDFHILPRLIIKFVLIFSYPFILYLFNFYEEIELDRIRGAYHKWKNPKNWKNSIR